MKSREPRQTVLIPAQIRGDSAWSEVCIRNVSSQGMMLEMSRPPAPGCYVELRRANVVVVARVMWAEADRCGLRTQAKVDLGALAGTKEQASRPPGHAQGGSERTKHRSDHLIRTADMARHVALGMQFACGAIFGGTLAILLSTMAYQAVARPFSAIREALR